MAITRIKNSSINNKTPKYNDVLAGLPFRPIIGTATDGGNGTSVSVAFTGNNVANGTITYTALSSPGGLTGTGTASPITVSGLTAGTAYTFQVKAGNSLGDSAYSAASNSVTPVTPSSFESIATATVSNSTTSSITFSSIPSTYQHLQIRYFVRGDRGNAQDWSLMRINGDTGNNYVYHSLYANSASVYGANSGGVQSSIELPRGAGDTAAANNFGAGIVDIHDYANTSKNKTVRIYGGTLNSNTSQYINLQSGLWLSTSAISSISILEGGGGTYFISGSTFALYGIKG